MQQIVVPPSPNWYGTHMADWAPRIGLYAYAAQNYIVLLNTRAHTVRTQLFGHTGRVTAVTFAGASVAGAGPSDAPDALPPLLVSSAADRSLRLWNVGTMQRLKILSKRPAEVTAIAASSDGRTVVLGDKAGALFAWDLSDPAAKPRKLAGCKQPSAVASLAAAPLHSAALLPGSGGSSGGLVLAGYADGTVLLLDWQRDCVVRRLERHAREVQGVRWCAAPSAAAAAAAAAAKATAAQAAAAAREAAAAAAAAAAIAEVDPAAAAQGGPSAAGAGEAAVAATSVAGRAEGSAAAVEEAADNTPDVLPPPPPPAVPVEGQASPDHAASGLGAATSVESGHAAAEGDAAAQQERAAGADAVAAEVVVAQLAAAEAAAADATAAEAAAAEAAAALSTAPPDWEVMLSSGADGVLHLYTLETVGDVASSSGSSVHPVLLSTLRLPRPHAGVTSSQSSRVWFTAAVVPPPPPAVPADASASQAPSSPQRAQQAQHVWLVTTGHGGAMLGWKVPLPCGGGGGKPAPTGAPCQLPVSHERSIFTLHAVSTLPSAAAQAAAAASGTAQQQQQQLAEDEQAPAEPQLLVLTSSMDRRLHLARLPHPAAVAQEALAAAPEGSWRRDAAAASAGDSAWRRAEVVWRLTGMGGIVCSLSLLAPAAAEQAQARLLDRQQEAEAHAQLQPQHSLRLVRPPLLLAVGGGDKTVRVLPLPRTPAGVEVSGGQQKQLLMWQGITGQVTAVAWQPLVPDTTADGSTALVAAQAAPAEQAAAGEARLAAGPDAAAAQAASAAGSATASGPAVAAATAVLAFGCDDGTLGLMLPSREHTLPLPVRHKAAVTDLRWALGNVGAGAFSEQPAGLLLASLSADGALLLWGPLPQPLLDLFPVAKGNRHAVSGGGSGGGGSWAAPTGPLAAALGSPADVGALLAAAAAADSAPAGAAVWFGPAQPTITAFAVFSSALAADGVAASGAPAAASGESQAGAPPEAGAGFLLAVAVRGGALGVLRVTTAHAAGVASLQLLWAVPGSGSPVSHLCFSDDGAELAAAAESGLLTLHAWAAQAGLAHHSAAALAAALEQGFQAAPAPAPAPATAAADASHSLGGAVSAMAWVVGGSSGPRSAGTSMAAVPGYGIGGVLAAALLSGGIQLLEVNSASPAVDGSSGSSYSGGGDGGGGGGGGGAAPRLVPTVLIRGHHGIIRSLVWLPAELDPAPEGLQQAQQEQQQWLEGPGQQQEGASQPRRRLLLLSGAEDQSVRLHDINRQLAAWQMREEEAAAAAAAEAAAAAATPVAELALTGAAAGVEEAVQPVGAGQAGTAGIAGVAVPHPPTPQLGGDGLAGTGLPVEATLRTAVVEEAGADASVAAVLAAPVPAPAEASSWALHEAAAPADTPATAAAAVPSKRKVEGSVLGDKPILPAGGVPDSDHGKQQAAQQACLQLAQQLLLEQQHLAAPAEAAPGAASAADQVPPPPPPVPPLSPDAAQLLGCAAEPLAASLLLQRQAEALEAAACKAGSAATRHLMAQRAAAAALFRGDVGAAIQVLLDHDALSADFVSLSAAAGPAAWRAVTLAYAAKLEHQSEPHLAALHLLAVGQEEEAVQVYRRAGLLREAVALASARLLPRHPLLPELHAAYAVQLSGKGQHEQAAAQLMAAGQWADAAAALASRNSAVAAAAAVQLCRHVLSSGAALTPREESRLAAQAEAAEKQLTALCTAGGLHPGAALAAVAVLPPAAQPQPPPQQQQVPSDRQLGASHVAGSSAHSECQGRQRRQYSLQQLLGVADLLAPATLPGLPAELAYSEPRECSGDSSTAEVQAGTQPSAAASAAGEESRRYSRQAMLELSDAASSALHGAAQQLRQTLPPALLSSD